MQIFFKYWISLASFISIYSLTVYIQIVIITNFGNIIYIYIVYFGFTKKILQNKHYYYNNY